MRYPVRTQQHPKRLPGLPGGRSYFRRDSVAGFTFEGEGGGEGGGGEGGGAGGDPEQLTKLRQWGDQLVAGVTANKDAILNEKKQLEAKLSDLEKKWGEFDPETVRAVMSRFKNDQEIQLIKEGKVDEVIQMRTDALRKDLDAKLNAAQGQNEKLEEQLRSARGRIKELTISKSVQDALPEDIERTAVPDVLREARELFDLDDEDQVVARGPDGTPLFAKDGKSHLSISEWLEGDRERNPHRYARSAGGGANGGGGARAKSPQSNVDGMSARQKLTHAIGGQA